MTAVDGALAALASVALGEHIAVATAVGLAIVIAGMLVVLHATAAQERAGVVGHSLTAVLLAAGAACGFGIFLLAAIRAGDALGDGQLQLIYRVRAVRRRRRCRCSCAGSSGGRARRGLCVTGRRRRCRPPASCSTAWPVAPATSRSRRCSRPSSRCSPSSRGVLVLGERLSRRQIGGLAGLLVGVAVIAGTHA